MSTNITLEEAKKQLHIDFTDDDTYIQTLCDLAEEVVAIEVQGRVLGEGTVETDGTTALVGNDTNFNDFEIGDTIDVDDETTRTISAITDNDNLTVSVAFTNTDSGLTYKVNRGLPASVPIGLEHAMLLIVAHFYSIREPVVLGLNTNKVPLAFDWLVAPYKYRTIA